MNRFKKSRLVIFSALVSLLVLFLVLLSLNLVSLSSVALGPLGQVERFLSQPVQWLSESRTRFLDLLETYEENKALKKKLADLENQASTNQTLQAENASLKEALGMAEASLGQAVVHADVTLRLPNAWLETLNVNVGRTAGLTEEMLVVANGGLIGYIKDMTETGTSVQLLTATSGRLKKVPVKINATETAVYGILTAYDRKQNVFVISQLNSETDIQPGQAVVSSDLGGKLPANVPIGQVDKVIASATNLSREIYVRPSADFTNIYTVSFIGK